MKHSLKIITFFLVILCVNLNAQNAKETRHKNRASEYLINDLLRAQTIVICEFKEPKGSVVTKVIQGDQKLIGQLWNSSMFPKSKFLTYEIANDCSGNARNSTMGLIIGFYNLSKDGKFITAEVIDNDSKPIQIQLCSIEYLKNTLEKKSQDNIIKTIKMQNKAQ